MERVEIKSPVLFLVFNRPEKTRQVFDVIRRVRPAKLYVAADAPRKNVASDAENCAKVREIVKNVDWECEAHYLFQENNLGCSLAGKTAYDWLFSHEDEMIFLEDDGLVSESFFWFCQVLLEKYRDDNRISVIGGVNYGYTYGNATYFFTRMGSGSYAKATWKRVYDLYEYKLETYKDFRNKNEFSCNFLNSFAYHYWRRAFDNYVKFGGNTYDLQNVYMVHKYNMYAIVPNINLCSNIGFDLEGSNTAVDPEGKLALKYGNRPRFELKDIIHPDKFVVDREFEKKYFKIRVLQGKPYLTVALRLYLSIVKSVVMNFIPGKRKDK